MLCHKKIKPKGIKEEDVPIDFSWVFYIGMNRLGFSYKQVGHLAFGLWADLFEAYKQQYNFETRKILYNIEVPEEKGSLMDL